MGTAKKRKKLRSKIAKLEDKLYSLPASYGDDEFDNLYQPGPEPPIPTPIGADCEKCGLLETCNGPVAPDGGDYSLLVVGEAPGEEEDGQGLPFVGKSGTLLRSALESLGYPDATYTNIVRCRPPNNKLSRKHIECCYRSLSIHDNTKVVLLLGNTPLSAVLGERGITSWNGVVVERDGIAYVPAYHPAYVLRNPTAMTDWLDALDAALSAYTGGVDEAADADYEFVYCYTEKEVYDMCTELMASPMISMDTEVAYLDAFNDDNRMLLMSFANDRKGWAVVVDHPDDIAPLADTTLDIMCNMLEMHPFVIGHNVRFDQLQCQGMLDCYFDAKGDTMLLSFLVESRRGIHGLKRLAGYHLGMFEYDSELQAYIHNHKECDPSRGGTYANVPLKVLLPYAAKDAIATYQLHGILYDMLTDKQKVLYTELVMPTSNMLRDMQANGMCIDYYIADRYRRVYASAKADELDAINNDPHVIEYVRRRQNHDKKFKAFNPGSWQQKAMVLYGDKYAKWMHGKPTVPYMSRYYGLKPMGFSESGNPSSKRSYIEPYRETCPLVEHLIMYSLLDKMLGTYINHLAYGDFASSDGRVRPSYLQHVVETGRLSSARPNAQNIPTPEKEPGTILAHLPIKNIITHTWTNKPNHRMWKHIDLPEYLMVLDGNEIDVNDGHVMAVDYSGMELRVFAALSGCEAMMDIHRSGKDFHTMVAVMASGLPEEAITKPIRYRYKWTNWTLLYGGSAHTLVNLYGMALSEAEETVRSYYAMFPEVLQYKKACVEFARQHGYIETPFGRHRLLPYILDDNRGKRSQAERAAVNTPVQGGAGEIMLLALTLLQKAIHDKGFKSLMVNTVHDSVVFDVYPGELIPLAKMCVMIMEDVVAYAAIDMPNVDMSWMDGVPLRADVDIGSHYGAYKTIKANWRSM